MRSIPRRVIIMQQKYPTYPSFINFGRAITGQKFCSARITRAFNELVDKDEYSKEDKKDILKHFVNLSNSPEPYKKEGDNDLRLNNSL